MRWLVYLLLLLPVHSIAQVESYERLGTFERRDVDRVLEKMKLTVTEPKDKRIGTIHIVSLEVFSEDDGFLEWFNLFHRTTRDEIIRRELLIEPGQRWDQALVDETLRKIRNPFLSNVVVILPIQSPDATIVDVLVVTRDVWSLRLNTNFQVHDGVLRLLNTSISENNFLGWRKTASLQFNMDQGVYWAGPYYSDPNLFGSRLQLQTQVSTIHNRKTNAFEGTSSNVVLSKPLWSLASIWAWSIRFQHGDYIERRFLGNSVGLEYDYQRYAAQVGGSATLGERVKHSVGLSYRFSDKVTQFRSASSDTYKPPPSYRDSAFVLGYSLYTPKYVEVRDIDSFDFREDYRVGPTVSVSLSQGLPTLGADEQYNGVDVSASWLFSLPHESILKVASWWYGRFLEADFVDHSAGASFYLATPRLGRFARFVARVNAWRRFRNGSESLPYSLGGENGLRGYAIGEFQGETVLLTQVEMRTMPLHMGFLRAGAVLFWDMGHASTDWEGIEPHHDVGVGLRLLIPQANPYVLRADWAFATNGRAVGWPGRLSFGFQQVF